MSTVRSSVNANGGSASSRPGCTYCTESIAYRRYAGQSVGSTEYVRTRSSSWLTVTTFTVGVGANGSSVVNGWANCCRIGWADPNSIACVVGSANRWPNTSVIEAGTVT